MSLAGRRAAPDADPVAAIARSVLYEGYVLWPYHRSALKNQRRWTFGGVYPRAYSQSGHDDDAWLMRTECLLELDSDAVLDVSVRFLHVVERRVEAYEGGGATAHYVDSITVDDVTHASWEEAAEREVIVPTIHLRRASDEIALTVPIRIDAGIEREPLVAHTGAALGAVVRSWSALEGAVDVRVRAIAPDCASVSVEITNSSVWNGETREQTLARSFASTHTVLRAHGGRFVSAMDPPSPSERTHVCRNVGTFPVLAGVAPDRSTMLSSPIILYDYPQVAPESSGDFFDGGEIDQLLVLSVLSMTEDERRRARETDVLVAEMLDRCDSLSPEAMLRMHGVTRELPNDGRMP